MQLGASMVARHKLRLQRQQVYMRALQENIPDTPTQLGGVLRGSASSSPRFADHAAIMSLPDGWLDGASKALAGSLDGIVPHNVLQESDLFLRTLLHPSFLRLTTPHSQPHRDALAALRQRYAMPHELLVCGSANIRLVREAVAAASRDAVDDHSSLPQTPPAEAPRPGRVVHDRQRTPVLTDDVLASFPALHNRDGWLLFHDSTSRFSEPALPRSIPLAVLVTAETSLCGAIALTCGVEALLAYVSQSLEAVQQQQQTHGETLHNL